jgi:hypothetical protein
MNQNNFEKYSADVVGCAHTYCTLLYTVQCDCVMLPVYRLPATAYRYMVSCTKNPLLYTVYVTWNNSFRYCAVQLFTSYVFHQLIDDLLFTVLSML